MSILTLDESNCPFEIEIQSLENVFKLSQNRDEKSFENIIEKLKELGGDSALIAHERNQERGVCIIQIIPCR